MCAGAIDTVWISLLLAAVGETLSPSDDFNVCGLTVSRKKFKVCAVMCAMRGAADD